MLDDFLGDFFFVTANGPISSPFLVQNWYKTLLDLPEFKEKSKE